MEKRNFVMIALCVAIGVMAIAYAAFSSTLTVDGTITASGEFAVTFTEDTVTCTATEKKGADTPTATVTKTGATTATFTAALYTPGDVVTCVVPTENTGNLKAKLTGVTVSNNLTSSSTPIAVTASATDKLAADATGNVTVVMTYNWQEDGQPTTTSATFTVTANYTQDI